MEFFEIELDWAKTNLFWSNRMLPMQFIQIHNHKAGAPILRPLALVLWLLVVSELIFVAIEQ